MKASTISSSTVVDAYQYLQRMCSSERCGFTLRTRTHFSFRIFLAAFHPEYAEFPSLECWWTQKVFGPNVVLHRHTRHWTEYAAGKLKSTRSICVSIDFRWRHGLSFMKSFCCSVIVLCMAGSKKTPDTWVWSAHHGRHSSGTGPKGVDQIRLLPFRKCVSLVSLLSSWGAVEGWRASVELNELAGIAWHIGHFPWN